MAFFKLVLAFSPWLAFLFIAQGSMFRLKLGLVLSLALSLLMGLAKLHRGVILWVGLLFFSAAGVAVIGFESAWAARYMGMTANLALAGAVWFGLAIGRPFTLDYSKDHAPTEKEFHADFIRSNYKVALVWAIVFTINACLALAKTLDVLPRLAGEIVSYTLLLAVATFTAWYPGYARAKRQRAAVG
jgi:vacuolar-type H+-ATPase subunit I/STV1